MQRTASVLQRLEPVSYMLLSDPIGSLLPRNEKGDGKAKGKWDVTEAK